MLKKQCGIGLIESLLIVLFVAIGIVGIIKFQHVLSYSSNTTQQQADATQIAISQIESLRDFQTLNSTTGYTAYDDIASGTATKTVGNTSFSLSWTVTNTASPAYKTINMVVSWQDRFGSNQTIQLTTIVTAVDPKASASIF